MVETINSNFAKYEGRQMKYLKIIALFVMGGVFLSGCGGVALVVAVALVEVLRHLQRPIPTLVTPATLGTPATL